ncbi:hypothetical protein OIDMADRAFT_59328 [Oidiodendron maius Zn]|uniref:Uncharacterized protein n=1 Tax=Oidiodendron maius (strain Zn) TaxID=913774 RepID=A0A0C3GZ55_OIDMZ|nr:hypothetical protein OIDMADRAFT_59328 [Oidiodendron maius Zn]
MRTPSLHHIVRNIDHPPPGRDLMDIGHSVPQFDWRGGTPAVAGNPMKQYLSDLTTPRLGPNHVGTSFHYGSRKGCRFARHQRRRYALYISRQGIRELRKDNELQPINNAVRLAWGAVAKISSDDPDLAERQNELGVMLESRGTDDRAMWLNNFGNMLESLFEETGTLARLESAIQSAREALNQLSSADADQELRASLVGNLGNKLRNRHEATGDIVTP